MADFEMEFEITGLKVKIKSDRAQVPQALAAAQNQAMSMMQSAAALASGKIIEGSSEVAQPKQVIAPTADSGPAKRTVGRKPRNRGESATAVPIDFKHDAEKYGHPDQSWNTATKSIWLLYIVGEQTDQTEASAPTILATFNKHFKQFGPLNPKNVSRDLGNSKSKNNFLGSDTTKDPQLWYLLAGGKIEAQKLVQQSMAAKTNVS